MAGLAFSGLIGWGRLDVPLDERLRAVAGVAVVVVVAVEGAFDAVLLLATPTLIFWGAMGALLPPPPTAATVPLSKGRRALLGAVVLFTGLAAAEYSALKIASMAAYSSGQLGRAVSLDPGSYRARFRYAQLMMSRTSRTRGCVEAKAALALFPRSPDAKRLASGCN
jgi:hypothetical protein